MSTGSTKAKDIEFQSLVSVTWAVFDFKTLAALIVSVTGLSVSQPGYFRIFCFCLCGILAVEACPEHAVQVCLEVRGSIVSGFGELYLIIFSVYILEAAKSRHAYIPGENDNLVSI